MTEIKVHTVQRLQPEVLGRVAAYLDDPGFDPYNPNQAIGITRTEEHRRITGAIALQFPLSNEARLEITHLKTEENYQPLFQWAARTGIMIGRPVLHIVTANPQDARLLTEQYGFISNGTPLSLVRRLEDRI